jgi:type II secretory pathway pseudopilin PulG
MSLVELLIAMVVTSIGVAALVAGFSSGFVSINRAHETSTAGALADQKMELYRQAAFTSPSLEPRALSGAPEPGSDGRMYWVGTSVSWTCVVGPENTTTNAAPPTCTGAPPSRPVKVVSIEVRDSSLSGKLLFTESATFDSSTS